MFGRDRDASNTCSNVSLAPVPAPQLVHRDALTPLHPPARAYSRLQIPRACTPDSILPRRRVTRADESAEIPATPLRSPRTPSPPWTSACYRSPSASAVCIRCCIAVTASASDQRHSGTALRRSSSAWLWRPGCPRYTARCPFHAPLHVLLAVVPGIRHQHFRLAQFFATFFNSFSAGSISCLSLAVADMRRHHDVTVLHHRLCVVALYRKSPFAPGMIRDSSSVKFTLVLVFRSCFRSFGGFPPIFLPVVASRGCRRFNFEFVLRSLYGGMPLSLRALFDLLLSRPGSLPAVPLGAATLPGVQLLHAAPPQPPGPLAAPASAASAPLLPTAAPACSHTPSSSVLARVPSAFFVPSRLTRPSSQRRVSSSRRLQWTWLGAHTRTKSARPATRKHFSVSESARPVLAPWALSIAGAALLRVHVLARRTLVIEKSLPRGAVGGAACGTCRSARTLPCRASAVGHLERRTLRRSRLNSTPIRWMGSPRPRYLPA